MSDRSQAARMLVGQMRVLRANALSASAARNRLRPTIRIVRAIVSSQEKFCSVLVVAGKLRLVASGELA